MSENSSQRRLRIQPAEEVNERTARIMDRNVISERNILRADFMDRPLASLREILEHYHWGYLFSCACTVFTRLVRLFYANPEVAQDDEQGIVLQSTVDGFIIIVDALTISNVIGVPLGDSATPFTGILLPPSLDDLRDFFRAVPQGEERSTSIRIGALAEDHRMMAKIVQHNLWPVARRSDLTLKRAQLVYAILMRMPFCLCRHILGVILEARDDHHAGLPFGCLLTRIILQSGIPITGEPKLRLLQPLSKQTLMKSNAQLRRDDSEDDMPAPPPIHVAAPDMASSSQTMPPPPPPPTVDLSPVMEAIATLQGTVTSMQWDIRSITKRVEQTQLDLQYCMQFHHPDSSDDEATGSKRSRRPRS